MDALTLKVGRLSDKLKLYEPVLSSLSQLALVPEELGQIYKDLRDLKDSKIEVRERLTTLFNTQAKGYEEILKKLEEKARLQEKEIEECPVNDLVTRVSELEKALLALPGIEARLGKCMTAIDSFKLQGWNLLLRLVPWVIATAATVYAVAHN